jgi:type IV secretory pathway TraG/TraD family ATPase VirD4
MKIDSVVCEGGELRKTPPFTALGGEKYKFFGTGQSVGFDDGLLSKHMAFLGSIGTGKTTAILQVIGQIKRQLGPDDVLIIFDSKGEFRQAFAEEKDVIISNEVGALADYWNIFSEIDAVRLEENISEISRSLFFEKLRDAKEPFFPNAAKDLFGAILHLFYKSGEDRNNRALREFFDECTPNSLKTLLTDEPDLKAAASYLSGSDSLSYGIFAELQQLVREIFIGNFRKEGGLSTRRLVRDKGGRAVFVEYDLGIGNTLAPIYRLLFDMAVKEALSRKSRSGNVYLICDEFKLVPNLQHIDDAVNFGRGLGLKLVIGAQNVSQLYAIYGKYRAESILSGFSTLVRFRLNDEASRRFVRGAFGNNRKVEAFLPAVHSRGLTENSRVANVVEDWDIARLAVGEAVVGFPGQEPFLFQFKNFMS